MAFDFMRRGARMSGLGLVLAACLAGQGSAPFQAMRWRMIGPFRGGRAVAAIGIPGQPGLFYFGAVGGGVWRSRDAGTTWTPLFDQTGVSSIGDLVSAPSDGRVLYAGTGEADIRSDLSEGAGVYKSTDGGEHWEYAGLRETRQIGRVLVHPSNPEIVYVAALGHAYAPNPERGVYKSTDGGRSWSKVLDRGPQVGAVDLAMDMQHPDTLYASMWAAQRTPWSQYPPNQGPGSGLFKTTDGGAHWTELKGSGLPEKWRRSGVTVVPGGQRVYVLVEASQSGLYQSDDSGATWQLVSKDPRLTSRNWYFSFVTVDPEKPDVVYVPNVALMRSTDGGRTFGVLRGAPGGDDYHSLWVDPTSSSRLILASDQGVSVSLNGGETWTPWYNQPTAQMYHVIADKQFPYHVCGAQQDSGTLCVPSRTDHPSISERDFEAISGNEAGWVAPDPSNPALLYVSDVYGDVIRFDRRTSQAQTISPWPVPAFGSDIAQRKFRDPWTPALVFSPADPHALYLATQNVLKTTDGGLHWNAISPDLTGDKRRDGTGQACPGAADVATARECGYGVVFTIAPSAIDANLIWSGSDSGLVHVTRDGKNWTNVTPPEVSAWSKVTHVEASHFDAGTAWAAVDRHRLDDNGPYLYRTRDFGRSWKRVDAGIPDGAFLNAVREDPVRRGLLFAATERGVYVSVDDGDRWQGLQLNLPPGSVRDLWIAGDDLLAATHGRSFWVLDDISPLRAARGASGGTYLYPPAKAMRIFHLGFQGTPLPPEVPQAKNPPEGAVIDYELGGKPSGPLILEVLDGAGQLVRRIRSDEPTAPVPADVPIAARWFEGAARLSTDAGHNRYVWDLRSDGPEGGAEMEDGPLRGPLVLPGEYKLRLTVEGTSFEQPLTVAQDPRAPVDLSVLTKQRDFALTVLRAMAEVDEIAKSAGADVKKRAALIRIEMASAYAAATSADRAAPVQAEEVFDAARAELAALQHRVGK